MDEYGDRDADIWDERPPKDGIEQYAREVDPFYRHQPPNGLIDQDFYLAVAKKAAEYSRAPETDKWLQKHNTSLWIALRRLDVAIAWQDPEGQGHLNQRVVFTGKNFWEEI